MSIYDVESGKIIVIPITQIYVGENAHMNEGEVFNDYPTARKRAQVLFESGKIVLICPIAEILGFIT